MAMTDLVQCALCMLLLIAFLIVQESDCYSVRGRFMQRMQKTITYAYRENPKHANEHKYAGRRMRVNNLDYLESTPFEKLSTSQRTSMIRGYGERKELNKALGVLRLMREHGIMPTDHQFSAILVACRQSNQPDIALGLYDRLIAMGVPTNTIIYNTLLSALVKNYDDCMKVFLQMDEKKVERDEYTYSTMLKACSIAKDWKAAVDLYKMGVSSGDLTQPSAVLLNSALTACVQGRVFRIGWDIFKEAYGKAIPRDNVSFTLALQLLAQPRICTATQNFDLAVDVFNSMETGMLQAKTALQKSSVGSQLSDDMEISDYSEAPFLYPSEDQKFAPVSRDEVVISAMLLVCKEYGKYKEATDLVDRMLHDDDALKLDSGFVFSERIPCTVRHLQQTIAACGAAGRLREAIQQYDKIHFHGMKRDSAVYNEMISIFQKAGTQCRLLAERVRDRRAAGEKLSGDDKLLLADIDANAFDDDQIRLSEMSHDLALVQKSLFEKASRYFNMASGYYREAVAHGMMAEQWAESSLTRNPLTLANDNTSSSSGKETRSIQANVSSFSDNIKSEQTSTESISRNASSNDGTSSDDGLRKSVDLHKYPLAVALTAVHDALDEIKETFASVDGKHARQLQYDLYIITGRGNHVDSNGKRGVLKKAVAKYLTVNYPELDFIPIPGNDGCLVIRAETLRRWVQGSASEKIEINDTKLGGTTRNGDGNHNTTPLRVSQNDFT